MNAILYVDRTSHPRALPAARIPALAKASTHSFAHWQHDGIFTQLTSLLRRSARIAEGHTPDPSACVIDAQTIKTSANVPATGQGYDPGKKIAGRKRSIVIDTLAPATRRPGHYRRPVRCRRDPASKGFIVPPRRWAAERTLGWLMLHRRLARDYEARPDRSEAMIHIAMIDVISRRLTGEATPTWRGT
ncbi:DDE transposase [Planobispora siamensis]|uniref:DDE transposase n=1 Tax=Planobispora siamensis TaxID=936338 RepID=A0A8J3SIG1_9ACTN|nr:DDE transposase [Planobispora siamensis]